MDKPKALELVASHCINCRGVALNLHNMPAPVFAPEKAVPAIIDKYRDGMTQITCPMLASVSEQKESCAALQAKDVVIPARCAYSTLRSEDASTFIRELHLSVRTNRCLDAANIRSISQLLQVTAGQLSQIRNFGPTSLAEIRQQLALRGLALKGDTVDKQ